MARRTDGTAMGPTSNDADHDIKLGEPYSAKVTIEGTSAILFHRWGVEAVAEKAAAAKGSRAKKEDNVESYVYRDDDNHICIPGEYLRQSVIGAAKFRQDPRSPRKSAMDLFKAGLIVLSEMAPILVAKNGHGYGPTKAWDYLDQRRVVIQRNGITRVRPAFLKGWRAVFEFQVVLAEYIDRTALNEVVQNAGRLIGLADARPTYGRFQVVEFK